MPYQVSQSENILSVSAVNELFQDIDNAKELLEFLKSGGGVGGGSGANLGFRDNLKDSLMSGGYSGMQSGQQSALCTPLDSAANNNYAGTAGCIRMVNSASGVQQGSVVGVGGKL